MARPGETGTLTSPHVTGRDAAAASGTTLSSSPSSNAKDSNCSGEISQCLFPRLTSMFKCVVFPRFMADLQSAELLQVATGVSRPPEVAPLEGRTPAPLARSVPVRRRLRVLPPYEPRPLRPPALAGCP